MRTLIAGCALLLLLAGVVAAQETEAEREAGRDVVRQIHELDQSLNVPQMVARLTATDKGRDQVIARVKQLLDTELMPMSDWLTQHPEIGFQETQAVEKLTSYLQAHDFDVTKGVACAPLSWPNIAVALPAPT
jgi:hypothetical protein